MSFTYLKGNCPVCAGARKDCRQSTTTQAVHCRAPEANPTSWQQTGFDAHGFSIWIESSQATDPGYWAEQERLKQERRRQQAEQRKRLLSITERDRQFRRVAGHSGLGTAHRQDIAERCQVAGLDDEAFTHHMVSQKLLFSWQPKQSFPGITAALPGTDAQGRLRNFQGWAIAIPDHQGRLLGCQIKPQSGQGYYWASSKAEGGNSPHLPNGEMPLGVYRPSVPTAPSGRIGTGEGYLKPAIAAERLGISFMGAAGGNFAGSPEQFKAAAEALADGQPVEIVYYIDAGMLDRSHSSVHTSWRKLAVMCEELGYSLKFAWWGQGEKHHGDVDEAPLEAIQNAELISMEALEEMIRQQGQEEWKAQYAELALQAWLSCRNYTPTTTTNQQYVEVDAGQLLIADIHALKSAMATGKTQALVELLEKLGLGAIAIGSRNGLLLNSCQRWGSFYHLHQDSAFGLVADPLARIACCIDSILHFADRDFDGKILILDEVLSIVKHGLLSGTLKAKRDAVLAKFEQAIKRAAVVVAWDGNNADIAINYLAALRGEHCKVIKALNEYRRDRLQVELVRALNDEGKVITSSNAAVLDKLGDALKAYQQITTGPRALVVVADSQRLCEALDHTYSEQGYKVLRIDSKTVTDSEIKRCLSAPDPYIEEYQPDLVILSPTAESGLDISIKGYFAKGFGLFFGVIDTATQMQILRRVRDCLDWCVWCTEYTLSEEWEGTRSPFARKLHRQLMEYLQADAIAALQGTDREHLTQQFLQQLQEQATSPHYQATLQFLAARNYERQNTRQCLQIALEDAGHHVQVIDVAKPDKSATTEAISEAKAAIIEADSKAIFSAPDISIAQAAKNKASFNASLEQRWAAEKAMLKARLPGIEHSGSWSWELIAILLFKNRGLIGRLERWWMLQHMEAAQHRATERWQDAISNNTPLTDISSDYRLLQALDHLGIAQLCDGTERDSNDPLIQEIYRKCKRSKRLQVALGRAPGRLAPLDWVGRLCSIAGIESKGLMKCRAARGGDGGDRSYTHYAPGRSPEEAAILEAIGKRFEKHLNPEIAESPSEKASEADHLPLENNISIGSGDPPQTLGMWDIEANSQYSPDDVIDAREMIAIARGQGAAALEELRLIIPSGLWQVAS